MQASVNLYKMVVCLWILVVKLRHNTYHVRYRVDTDIYSYNSASDVQDSDFTIAI
jgi:hypothetical protein